MKRLLFVVLLSGALAPGFVLAQDTAYKALRAVGTKRGEKALNQVTALIGHSGKPQPVDWLVALDDPSARGGTRELDVVAGQISSERTPVHPSSTGFSVIDLTKLNLDSDGAFQTAEREAKKNQVGFDSVNYRLSVDTASHEPVWTLELFDYEQRPVGTVRVSADSGRLLAATNWVPQVQDARNSRQRERVPSSDEQALNEPQPPPSGYAPPSSHGDGYSSRDYAARNDVPRDGDNGSDEGYDQGGSTNRFGASVVQFGHEIAHRTTRVFQTVGGWFQEKFTGRNTIDPKHGQDDDNSEEYQDSDRYDHPVRPTEPYNGSTSPGPGD